MNAAATPDICRVSAQPARSTRGLRKIPPPTPVMPDSSPMPAPSATARGTGTGLTSAGAFVLKEIRSEEHTSELQSRPHLVCRLLLEKKNLNRELANQIHARGPHHPHAPAQHRHQPHRTDRPVGRRQAERGREAPGALFFHARYPRQA